MPAFNLLKGARNSSIVVFVLFVAPGLVAQSNNVCVPPPGLVSWWRGEGNALDSVGTNHGSLRNGGGYAPGVVGQAFALDGVNDFVLVPDSASLRLSGALTFELWFKASDSRWGGLFDKRGGGANYGLIVSTDYGVQLYYDDPAVFGGDHPGNQFEIAAHFPLPSLNVWHHFAGTYRQADPTHIELKMYLDGALVESRLFSGNLANTFSAAPVAIGGVSGTCCYFPGLIDEVSLYNRALTADEIGRIHAAGPAGKCPPSPPACLPPPGGLVAWWPLDGDLRDRVGGTSLASAGAPVHTAGAVRQGLNFDGLNDSAVAAATMSMDVGAGPGMSVELWVNPRSLTLDQALLEWSSTAGPQPGLHLYANTGGPGAIFVNLTDINSVATHLISPPGTLQLGVFQHILFSYDRASGIARTYHNGRVVAAAFVGSLQLDTRPDLYFGRRILGGPDYWFDGVMDEVSLYNRALTPAEIAALFAAGSEGKCFTNTPPPQPPLITSQPQSLTVYEGEPAAFTVTASGAAPLGFQWRFQGGALGNETNSSLSIATAQPAQAGDYAVVVANAHGAITSTVARLTVLALPPCPALPPGLVSWWRAEGNALDAAGTNHGTLLGGGGYAPGVVGQAFALDGVNDFVLVPDSPTLDLTGGLTVELWFQANGWEGGAGLVDKRTFNDCNYGLLITTDYGLQFYYNDPTVQGGDHPGNIFEIAAHFPLPTTNDWHHLAGSFRQADPAHIEVRLYLDGALIESRLFSGDLSRTVNDAPVAIGSTRGGTGAFFSGRIDEVRLYNRALTPGEVRCLSSIRDTNNCDDARSIADILALVQSSNLPSNRMHPLRVSLEAAQRSLDRGNSIAAVNQLEAFKNKVRAQVRRLDPALADCLTAAANAVIGIIEHPVPAVAARAIGPTPALGRGTLERTADGMNRISFSGVPLAAHEIEASSDLITWKPVARIQADALGLIRYEEQGSFAARFYRLSVPRPKTALETSPETLPAPVP